MVRKAAADSLLSFGPFPLTFVSASFEKMAEGEPKVVIPNGLWQAAVIIALQSFSFGYVFSCLNSCLVTGDNNEGSDCFHGDDSSCPDGTMYNDINLSLSKDAQY